MLNSVQDIPRLRAKLAETIDRRITASQAAKTLLDMKTPYTEEICKRGCGNLEHWREGYDEECERLADLIGTEVSLFSAEFLSSLLFDQRSARNIESTLQSIAHELATEVTIIVSDDVPSSEGWTEHEIELVVDSYRTRVANHNVKLRDAHTRMKYLNREREAVPGFLKSKCIGMFGLPDWETTFKYRDQDFDNRLSHFSMWEGDEIPTDWTPTLEGERRDKALAENRKFVRSVDLRPQVMSAFWWSPVVGEERARMIAAILYLIDETVRPLPGEPDTLSGFGSHVNNNIKLESINWRQDE